MSAAARARISAAQKARWAKAKNQGGQAPHLTGGTGADQSSSAGEMAESEGGKK